MPGFFVIAAHSAFKYRGAAAEAAGAARELGVRYVAQGSIRRVNDRLRLNAQLVDTISGAVLWADRFDRNFAEIYGLQGEIAGKIAQAIIGPQQSAVQAERYKSPSLEAFDLCMKGRDEFRHSDESGTRVRPLFERVIELDPSYSEAYRWLALGESLSWLHFGQPMHPAREDSLANARKAVELDPSDSAAHGILGFIVMNERKLDESAAEFETALRLNPNDADAWNMLSDLRVMEGKGREAVECSERSLQLNPHPLAFYFWLHGQAQFAAGDYEAAVKTLRREETYRTGSRRILAAALAMLGRMDEARDEGRLFMAGNPHFRISYWVETQPFRDLKMRDRFVDAYRLAGLPE
ncbi:MAG: tetratricopeptide repeat protein [Aestuariivirga sp.]